MINLKRILVPIDFSEASEAALRYGTGLARAFNARLFLVHVPEHPGVAAATEYPIGLFETMQNAAHERLGTLLTDAEKRDLKVVRVMRLGTPADEIVRYAAEQEVDLIVMGTHGRDGVARVVVGSVTEKVVRRASCPVLTVRENEHEFLTADEAADETAFETRLTA